MGLKAVSTNHLKIRGAVNQTSEQYLTITDANNNVRAAISPNPSSTSSGTSNTDIELILGQWAFRGDPSGQLKVGRFAISEASNTYFGTNLFVTTTVNNTYSVLPNWTSGNPNLSIGQYGFKSNISSGSSLVVNNTTGSNRLFNYDRDSSRTTINPTVDHDYSAQLAIRLAAASYLGINIIGAASQSGNYVEIKDSSSNKQVSISPTGVVASKGLIVSSTFDETSPGAGNATVTGNVKAGKFFLSALNTAPTSSTDTGTLGEIRVDANYIYFCYATNNWKRSALTTW